MKGKPSQEGTTYLPLDGDLSGVVWKLLGFFSIVLLGIQVKIRVLPKTWKKKTFAKIRARF